MKKTRFIAPVLLMLFLTACGGQAAAPAAAAPDPSAVLMGNTWQWEHFTDPAQEFKVDVPENYTLEFQEDGTVSIKADCNRAIGSYTIEDSSISIEIGPVTKAMCLPDSRSDQFLKYLGFAAIYFFEDGQLLIDLIADGGTMVFNPSKGGEDGSTSFATEFSPNADPLFASLVLGGGETLWLDPTLVSVRSGTLKGPGIDAATLGEGCSGTIPTQPDVVFDWEEHEDLEILRVFTLSMGDPTLVVVTPSGEILCDDNFNSLVLDPFVEIKNPEVGRYAVFLGSFEGDPVEPNFLVITGHELEPATMDLALLFPRHLDLRSVSETLPLDTLEIESTESVQPPNGNLNLTDLPYQQELTGGGEIGSFSLDHDNHLCTGFVSAAPTFRFEWSSDADPLVVFFEGDIDASLMLVAPDGTFHCDDDYHGTDNLNPWLSLTPMDGTYNLWVGSFVPEVMATGMLTITNEADAVPSALTAADLE